MWTLLAGARKGRSILLTTHSMEEADVLGDRWALGGGGAWGFIFPCRSSCLIHRRCMPQTPGQWHGHSCGVSSMS